MAGIENEKEKNLRGDAIMERKKKNAFERYQNLKMEQKRLNDRMEDLLSEREQVQSHIVIDGVIASDREFPYTTHISKVEGLELDSDKFENHVINKELRRVRKMQDATDLALSEIREMVDGIEDEFIKAIITYRFIDGLSWRQVAFKMGGGNTEASVLMAYRRYANKYFKSC